MKLTKNTIAATFAARFISGLSASTALAAVHQTGRVYTGSQAGFELMGDSSSSNGRTAAAGTQSILKSSAGGQTNGRQG